MITCYTLVDITCTNFVRRPKTQQETFQRNQQRNYETFQQLISLRSQPIIIQSPTKISNINIDDYQFGEYYMPSVFNSVPIIDNLTETAKIHSMINTKGTRTNTYFLSEFRPT